MLIAARLGVVADTELDQAERFFKALLERNLSVELERYDSRGRQGAVDLVFPCAGGEAAVEVTFVQSQEMAEWNGVLNDQSFVEVDSRRGWTLSFPHKVTLGDIRARLGKVVGLCDEYGVDNPQVLPVEAWNHDIEWWTDRHLWLRAGVDNSEPGRVYLLPEGASGFPDAASMDAGMAHLLDLPLVARKVRKLANHEGAVERHLALGVDVFRPVFPLASQLVGIINTLPQAQPAIAPPVTHLWVVGQFSFQVLCWSASDGWTTHDL